MFVKQWRRLGRRTSAVHAAEVGEHFPKGWGPHIELDGAVNGDSPLPLFFVYQPFVFIDLVKELGNGHVRPISEAAVIETPPGLHLGVWGWRPVTCFQHLGQFVKHASRLDRMASATASCELLPEIQISSL